MVEAASLALADSLTSEERAEDRVYPNLTRIRDISTLIAMRVVKTAQMEVRVLFVVAFVCITDYINSMSTITLHCVVWMTLY